MTQGKNSRSGFHFSHTSLTVCVDGFHKNLCVWMDKYSPEKRRKGTVWERTCESLPKTEELWRLLVLLNLKELINSG